MIDFDELQELAERHEQQFLEKEEQMKKSAKKKKTDRQIMAEIVTKADISVF